MEGLYGSLHGWYGGGEFLLGPGMLLSRRRKCYGGFLGVLFGLEDDGHEWDGGNEVWRSFSTCKFRLYIGVF